MDNHKRRRNLILNTLRVTVSLAGMAVLLLRTKNLDQVGPVLRQASWLPFSLALLLFVVGGLVRAYRWGCLVWALGVKVSWWRLVRLVFVGQFFNLFLPTGLGGDAVKMYELAQGDGQAAAAISSVLMDRFLGLLVLFAQALLALAISRQLVSTQVRIVIGAVFAVCAVGLALVFQRTWLASWARRLGLDRLLGRVKIMRELYHSIYLYGASALLRATAASVVWNLILILANYLLGLSVGIHVSIMYYFLLIPIISSLLLIPSVGGFGLREAGYNELFSHVPGVASGQPLALAVVYDLTMLATALIGAILYIIQGLRGTRR